VCLKWKEVKN
jgi:hypothetical protein